MPATSLTPNCDHQKCPRILPNVPWGWKSLPVENHWISPMQTVTFPAGKQGTEVVCQPGFSPWRTSLRQTHHQEGTESKARGGKKQVSKHTDILNSLASINYLTMELIPIL